MSFVKFDPAAFLAGNAGKTFAGFATFTTGCPQTRNSESEKKALFSIIGAGVLDDDRGRASRYTPAKVARVAKAERAILDATDLRNRYGERAAICVVDGHQDHARAEATAWHEVAHIWFRQHGTRVQDNRCAGCGEPLSGSKIRTLPHGEALHEDAGILCLLAYEWRWKREAAAGLMLLGIPTPGDIAAEFEDTSTPIELNDDRDAG